MTMISDEGGGKERKDERKSNEVMLWIWGFKRIKRLVNHYSLNRYVSLCSVIDAEI